MATVQLPEIDPTLAHIDPATVTPAASAADYLAAMRGAIYCLEINAERCLVIAKVAMGQRDLCAKGSPERQRRQADVAQYLSQRDQHLAAARSLMDAIAYAERTC